MGISLRRASEWAGMTGLSSVLRLCNLGPSESEWQLWHVDSDQVQSSSTPPPTCSCLRFIMGSSGGVSMPAGSGCCSQLQCP